MRRAAGLTLVSLGIIGLTIWRVVLFRMAPPVPGVLLRHLGTFGFYVDPVMAPVSSVTLLTIGVLLLRHPKIMPTR